MLGARRDRVSRGVHPRQAHADVIGDRHGQAILIAPLALLDRAGISGRVIPVGTLLF